MGSCGARDHLHIWWARIGFADSLHDRLAGIGRVRRAGNFLGRIICHASDCIGASSGLRAYEKRRTPTPKATKTTAATSALIAAVSKSTFT